MDLQYKDYYLKTINAHTSGLKLVLGGTGLGKTHGMKEAVRETLRSEAKEKQKFIYITNRHSLIAEQETDFNKAGIKCCYLKNNREVIIGLIEGRKIQEVIDGLVKIEFFKYDELAKNKYWRDNNLNKLIEGIKQKIELSKKQKNKKASLYKTLQEELNNESNELFSVFRRNFALIAKMDKTFHQTLKSNEFIWQVFPYVEFENNPEANILLVTVKKVLMGFFDGKRNLKIASVENKIIFLDEFDFLEKDILSELCDEPSIENPLEFVRMFYERFKHWSKAEFWESSEELKGVKEGFNKVISYLDDSMQKNGLAFPNVIDFRFDMNRKETDVPYLLFQTDRIITNKSFFIYEKGNSFYVQDKKAYNSASPYILFNILKRATRKILSVFYKYSKSPNLNSEIIQKIWNRQNDNAGGRYQAYIEENCLYHRTNKKPTHEPNKDKSAYEAGYRLVKLTSGSLDTESAELGQIELFTSPEALVAKMSDNNLVFALSATADIPRTVRSFNIEWLKKNANFIPMDDVDYGIIKARRDSKAKLRQTKAHLSIAKNIDLEHPVGFICNSLRKDGYFSKGNKDDYSGEYRYERALRTFSTLYQCAEGDKHSHLIFLSTFDYFKGIIDYESNKKMKSLFNDCDKNIFSCERVSDDNKEYFNMTLNGKKCSVMLLNSDDAKELQESKKALEDYFSCFKDKDKEGKDNGFKDKVFVITQYNSASNGINLPCIDNVYGNKTDFKGIHLLEQNHFWFENGDDIRKFKNEEKQALWYLWKLHDAGQIYTPLFKKLLSSKSIAHPIKINITEINSKYKKTTDEVILNSISLYHQALGRIERTDHYISEVDVILSKEVFGDFYRFLSSESFKDIIDSRHDITSGLILNIHEAVLKEAVKQNIAAEVNSHVGCKKKNGNSIETIGEILGEIEKLKSGQYDEVVSNEIKKVWTDLREALLRHDYDKSFHFELIGRSINIMRDFCFETKYVNKNKQLFINPETYTVYKENVPTKQLKVWNLDSAYRIISNNRILKMHFEKNGFKTGFDIRPNLVNLVPTQYIYQAILLGAIGEQAISCLLNNEGVELENMNELDNSIFEVVDAKMKGKPVYFDFKNFGENTLDKFSYLPNDTHFDVDMNSEEFKTKMKNKYGALHKINNKAVLYILNLFSNQGLKSDFFDANMKRVQFEKDSCIRIIPSLFNRANTELYSLEFELTLNLLKSYEKQAV